MEKIEINDFRTRSLPLARIKKIMKADEDVDMISGEALVVVAKACEMFIMELTTRAWVKAEENRRLTLQKNDIRYAISRTDAFDFLVDIVPRDDTVEHEIVAGILRDTIPINNVLYPMPPRQHVAYAPHGPSRMAMGGPVLDQAHYGLDPHPSTTQMRPNPKQQDHSPNSDD
ncbi:nuclear transcription factor Y subunit C-1-like [Abrus precatorius]|uniref:Nuclear transcription factor Y subunit C-1-like n=1 Tax=Abrus precatorius TaxID=3816 RepID=A0A8B8K3A3_ABRPR|nr:nuclear transcription factor Y subunit C-1-like [Abrus precatorius]